MEEEKETSESKRTSKRAVSPRKAAPTPSPSSSNPRGILGTADEMQALDNIVPGTAKMRVDQYSKPIDHQRDMEVRAQRSALIVAVLGLLLSFGGIAIGSFKHQPISSISGGIVGVADLVALVAVFMRGVPR